jgi:hypothetical protein
VARFADPDLPAAVPETMQGRGSMAPMTTIFADGKSTIPPGVNPMKRFRFSLVILFVPALAVAVALVGCGGGDTKKSSSDGGGDKDDTGAAEKKPLAIEKRGTITGKVTLDGDKPDIDKLNSELMAQIKVHKDKDACLAGSDAEKCNQNWKIDENRGVANVFVWLRPPKDYYFKLTEKDLKPYKDSVIELKQPHCAFIPHAFTVFPSYYDDKTKKQKPTGQEVVVVNNATIAHNTKWAGQGQKGNDKLIAKGEKITIEPTLRANDKYEITFNCSAHAFMNAFARAFDHPFATVTDKDGNFKLENVPVGVDLEVVAWHEKAGYAQEGGQAGVKKKLKDGDELKFTIKK